MSNWRVIRYVIHDEVRFRLEDVVPDAHKRGLVPFAYRSGAQGYESPEALRKELTAQLAALEKPHMYVEPERVLEVAQ
jgi:hypothetical protein